MMTVELILGPILRRVVGGTATVWVQTSMPGQVTVRAGAVVGHAETLTVHDRHFALITVGPLPLGTSTTYRVELNGHQVWPVDHTWPAPVIRISDDTTQARLVFGSCRQLALGTTDLADALDAYARRLRDQMAAGRPRWPDSLLFIGDQIYADKATTFADYASLYETSWAKPAVRWLLSTVPSLMMFDDHEIIDDWNTSAAWRAKVTARPDWTDIIGAGLSSYWVYQHLGNLAPDELADDPVWQQIQSHKDEASAILTAFGQRADQDRGDYRWSVTADFGPTRLVLLDNRAGRVVEGTRSMTDDATWRWVERLAHEHGFSHFVLASSLPWLLAPSLHHLEAWNTHHADEQTRLGEQIRQLLDLEHWAAFPKSFAALSDLLDALSRKGTLDSLTVISGDVHHSYAVRADLGDRNTPIHQMVSSPLRHLLTRWTQLQLRLAWRRSMRVITTPLIRGGRRPHGVRRWYLTGKVHYHNTIGTLVYADDHARGHLEGTNRDGTLRELSSVRLTAR